MRRAGATRWPSQAKTIPDDLAPANLGSTAELAPGDHVAVVGFPFGIGPSVSAGVVSGLNREYRTPEGQRLLTRLALCRCGESKNKPFCDNSQALNADFAPQNRSGTS